MSQQDRRDFERLLAADPALQAAWDGFKETLTRVSAAVQAPGKRTAADMQRDFAALRAAAARVEAEAGEEMARH